MNRLYIFLIFVLTSVMATSQPLPEWTTKVETNFNSAEIGDKPKLKFDNEGYLILGGNIYNSSSSKDYLIIKYDLNGNEVWQKTYNGGNNLDDELRDYFIDSQNNIYVTGLSHIDSLNTKIVTIKYSSSGSLLWENSYEGIADRGDWGNSVTIDMDFNTYITGATVIDTLLGKRLIVLKIDSNGNQLWSEIYSSQDNGRYEGMIIKIINNKVQVLGKYHIPNSGFGCIILKQNLSGSIIDSYEVPASGWITYYLDNFGNSYVGGWGSYEITKVSSNGVVVFTDSIQTNLPSNVSGDEVRAITVDTSQNVYISGRHYGDDYGGANYSNADILTVKYDSLGNKLWESRYEYLGNNAADIANSITIDDYLNVYVGGESQATIAGEDYDYIVVKYNSEGQEIGTIRYDDENGEDDVITSIIVTDTNQIFVTGLTLNNDQSTNTTTQKYSEFVITDIIEPSHKNTIPIYPNPSSTHITIELPTTPQKNTSLTIYNLNGQQLITQAITEPQTVVDVSGLPKGVYFVKVMNDKNVIVQKVIKE